MRTAVIPALAVVLLCCSCGKAGFSEKAANPKAAEATTMCRRWLDGVSKDRRSAGATDVLEACASLFTAPRLKRLLAHQQALPADRRAPLVAKAFKQTYCKLLEEPHPAICDSPFPSHPLRLRQELWLLLWKVLVYELGAERAASIYGPMLLADLGHRPMISLGTPGGLAAGRIEPAEFKDKDDGKAGGDKRIEAGKQPAGTSSRQQ